MLEATRDLWEEVRGEHIFLTGGTGFFGCWLLESFLWANERLDLHGSATVLTRDPESFHRKARHLANNSAVTLQRGDVRDFSFPDGDFPFVIHAATEASAQQEKEAPLEMLSTIVDGTRRALDFARSHGTKKFLLMSSGAVYGKQPEEITHVPESFCGGPDPISKASVYAEGKRMAELLCSLYSAGTAMECKIARCFAFAGPYLPLDTHFAVGNFIRDAMQRKEIHVRGDGTPYRSYMYPSDAVTWLWTMLFRAPALRPLNVGSEHAISIRELARITADTLNPGSHIIVDRRHEPGTPVERYVPCTRAARETLGLAEQINLQESILRTAWWHGYGKSHESSSD